jgi:hypothetical protein
LKPVNPAIATSSMPPSERSALLVESGLERLLRAAFDHAQQACRGRCRRGPGDVFQLTASASATRAIVRSCTTIACNAAGEGPLTQTTDRGRIRRIDFHAGQQ